MLLLCRNDEQYKPFQKMLPRTIIAIMTTVSTIAQNIRKSEIYLRIFLHKNWLKSPVFEKKIIGTIIGRVSKEKKELEGIQNHDSLKECMHVKFQYFSYFLEV